jgi:hypothetical protein
MISNWKRKVLGHTMQSGSGGGSSGGGTTTQSNQYSSVSPWASPYIGSILGAAQQQAFNIDPSTGQITGMNPYVAYGQNGAGLSAADQAAAQSSVAGFTPLQQQSFQGAANLQTPGQFGAATGAASAATGNMFNLANTSNPQDFQQNVGGYMNPYIQNALNPALQLSNQQYGQSLAQEQGAATGAGAFGGSREGLMAGLNQQNNMLANNQLIGNAYNNAFTAAQNQYNQSGQFALNANQAALQGANTLGNLGTSQLAAQQGILGLQNTYGTQQQQNNQNVINQAMQNFQTAQQYPMTQLSNLKNLASGLPITDVTTTQQGGAPTTFGQLSGLGLTGLGAYGAMNSGNSPTINITSPTPQAAATSQKAGGITKLKKYSSGGLVDLSLYNALKGSA